MKQFAARVVHPLLTIPGAVLMSVVAAWLAVDAMIFTWRKRR
jgi:uncharacterized membrane protein